MPLPERLTRLLPVPLRLLVPLALLACCLWGFVELAEAVGDGSTRAVDEWLLLQLRTADRSDPVGPTWFEEMARDITALGGTVVLGLVLALTTTYLALRGHRRSAVVVLGSILLGFATIYLLKAGFARPRPDLVPHRQEVYTKSFPSGHAMGSALTYLTLAALLTRSDARRRVQVFFVLSALLLTVAVGLSRVYLGVHHPTDVLAGWGAGAGWAIATWLLADTLARRDRRSTHPPT